MSVISGAMVLDDGLGCGCGGATGIDEAGIRICLSCFSPVPLPDEEEVKK